MHSVNTLAFNKACFGQAWVDKIAWKLRFGRCLRHLNTSVLLYALLLLPLVLPEWISCSIQDDLFIFGLQSAIFWLNVFNLFSLEILKLCKITFGLLSYQPPFYCQILSSIRFWAVEPFPSSSTDSTVLLVSYLSVSFPLFFLLLLIHHRLVHMLLLLFCGYVIRN